MIGLSLPGENMSPLRPLYLADRGQDGDKEDDADDMYKIMVSFRSFNTLHYHPDHSFFIRRGSLYCSLRMEHVLLLYILYNPT